MMPSIRFRLGNVKIKIEGDHQITHWASNIYKPLFCSDKGDNNLIFSFVEQPLHPCSEGAVGDEKTAIGNRVVSYRGRHFDFCINESEPIKVDIFQRDRRSLLITGLLKEPEEAWKMWLTHGASLNMRLFKDFAYSIFPLATQYALLKCSNSLIHASGFSVEGRGVLLPAWGGVGKSMLVSRAVLHGVAKFIADDYAVIDKKGMMYLNMLPIHIYAYHLEQDKKLEKRIFEQWTRVDRIQWLLSKIFRAHKAVRWISPEVIFGRENLALSAPIEHVIVLYRGKTQDFVWEPCSAEEAARPCVGIIMSEIKDFSARIARAEAGWHQSLLFSLRDIHKLIFDIYVSAFSNAACARLLIPKNATGDALVAYLRNKCSLIDRAFMKSR